MQLRIFGDWQVSDEREGWGGGSVCMTSEK